ncbi:hypothetical protein V8D89_015196 [Ganoderma adspersum]
MASTSPVEDPGADSRCSATVPSRTGGGSGRNEGRRDVFWEILGRPAGAARFVKVREDPEDLADPPRSTGHMLGREPATQMTLNTLHGREPQACKVRSDPVSVPFSSPPAKIAHKASRHHLDQKAGGPLAFSEPREGQAGVRIHQTRRLNMARRGKAQLRLRRPATTSPYLPLAALWRAVNIFSYEPREYRVTYRVQGRARRSRGPDGSSREPRPDLMHLCVDLMLLANRNSPPTVSDALQISLVSAAQGFGYVTRRRGSGPCDEARAPSSQFRNTAKGERAYEPEGPGIKPAAWLAPAKRGDGELGATPAFNVFAGNEDPPPRAADGIRGWNTGTEMWG